MNAREKYSDIIDMPHHVSSSHPQMSRTERAAQFSSFAALRGYEDKVEETARNREESYRIVYNDLSETDY